MIKTLARCLILCLLAALGAPAVAEEAHYATETPVEFSGVLGMGLGYDANDKEERYYLLKLDQPITVSDKEFRVTETRVTKIQLAFPYEISVRQYKNRRVTVKGSLFHSFTAHHHTKILMWMPEAEGIRLAAPQ